MAEIRRIGHDHQAPLRDIPVVVLVVLGDQAVIQDKKKAAYCSDPKIFKIVKSLIRSAPDTPNPPMGGLNNIF